MKRESLTKSSVAFLVGVALLVFSSIIIGLLHVGVFYLFGVPIITLLIGLICVWLSSATIRKKVVVSLAPLILIPVIFLGLVELNRADPAMYLIPADFRGQQQQEPGKYLKLKLEKCKEARHLSP